MGEEPVIARRPTWLMVSVAMCAAIGAACVFLFQPESQSRSALAVGPGRPEKRASRSRETSLNRLLELRPAADEQWLVLGQLAMTKGKDGLALESLARVSDRHPMAAGARIWEGTIELENQRARKAEAAFLRALRLDPRDTTARRQLISLYCIQSAGVNFPSSSLCSRADCSQLRSDDALGSSLASSWDPDEVCAMLERFVKADPDDRISRLVLAEALRRLRRPDDVEADLPVCHPPTLGFGRSSPGSPSLAVTSLRLNASPATAPTRIPSGPK